MHQALPRLSALVLPLLLAAAPHFDASAQTVQRRDAARARPSATTRPPSPQSVLKFTPGDDRRVADWTQ
ncbi:MAG TPA: hypothetical protein VER32_15410, partial [Pyrinomonadaceae bacterium]|nr:hypothetical protein [Pyrinomonadaceae bacterium]